MIQDPQKRSPFWIAVCSISNHGKTRRIWRTTKVAIKPLPGRDERADGTLPTRRELRHQAEEVARGIERALRAEAAGSASEANLKRILSDVLERTEGRRLVDYTIESWLDEWIASRQTSVGRQTLGKYQQVRKDFLRSLGTRRANRLDAISPSDFIRYRDWLIEGGRASRTVEQTVSILSYPFTLAWKQGHLKSNPLAGLPAMKRTPRQEKGVFTPEEVQRIVEIAPLDWKGVILVGYYTGARLQDACHLRWVNIELDNRLIRFVARKTGRAIGVAIHPELEEHLFSLTMTDDPKAFLFPSLAQKRSSGKAGLSWTFRRLMEEAGVVAGLARARGGTAGKSISLRSFHSLRHTFNSALANAGVSQEIRRELVGHASDQMNRHYTHMELATFQQAISSLPRLSPGKDQA